MHDEGDVAGEERRSDEADPDQKLCVEGSVAAGRSRVMRELDERERDADRVYAARCLEVRERQQDDLVRADLRRQYDRDVQAGENRESHSGRSASASISTFHAGSSNPAITSIAVAGRTSPNSSPCARPTAFQS